MSIHRMRPRILLYFAALFLLADCLSHPEMQAQSMLKLSRTPRAVGATGMVPRPQNPGDTLRITPGGLQNICPKEELLLTATTGFSEYMWSTGTTGQSLTVSLPGQYWVDAKNAAGQIVRSDTVTVLYKNAPNPSITGERMLCEIGTPLRYFTNSAPWWLNEWTVTGGTISGRNDRDTVYVLWDANARGTLTIRQTESRTGCIATVSDSVFVHLIDTELSLKNDTLVCSGGPVSLSAPPGYDGYLWSNGMTTPSIEVAEDGAYFVTITQANCSASSDTVRVWFVDEIPVEISGPAIGCRGDEVQYRATPYLGAVYTWSIQSGEIVSGQGSATAAVQWTSLTPGTIRVDVEKNLCSAGDSMAVTVHQVQKPTLTLDGEPNACEGDTVTITAIAGYSGYLWTTGDTTRSIRVTESGHYAVTGLSFTGCSAASDTVELQFNPVPEKPAIVQSESTLTCTVEGAFYTWYRNGDILPADTSRTLLMRESGAYRVTVTNAFGCSATSDVMTFVGIGTHVPALARAFDISPNPNNGAFEVALEFAAPMSFSIRIVNTLGQTVFQETVSERRVSYSGSIALDSPPGVYFFLLESGGRYDYKTVVVR